jgi:hypothetical protein
MMTCYNRGALRRVGLAVCGLVVIASLGFVVWKSGEEDSDGSPLLEKYADEPQSLIEASVTSFERLSSHRVRISTLTEQEGEIQEYGATIDSSSLDTIHITVLQPGSFEGITNGHTAWIRDCGEFRVRCDEWSKWPYAQFLVSHAAGVYENSWAVILLDMSQDAQLVGTVRDGDSTLAHLHGRVNPERALHENILRRLAVTSGLMSLSQHCGQPIPDSPTPAPGSCPDLNIDENVETGRSGDLVDFYDEYPAELDAWIDLDTLLIRELSVRAKPDYAGQGLLYFNARYSHFNSATVEVPPNAREAD